MSVIKVQTLCWGNLGESCLTAQCDDSLEDMFFVYIGGGGEGLYWNHFVCVSEFVWMISSALLNHFWLIPDEFWVYSEQKCSSELQLQSILGIMILCSKSSSRSTINIQYQVYWFTSPPEMLALWATFCTIWWKFWWKMARKWRWRKFFDSWQWTVIVTWN